MISTMIHVLEALQGAGDPALVTLQLHPVCGTQHDDYLAQLTRLLGPGVDEQRGGHRWVRWLEQEIVLYEPI